MTHRSEGIVRYSATNRFNHWITGICFVLLLLSGLSMFHPMLFFLSNFFGGGEWTRAVHPWIGCVMFASYMGMIIQFWRDEIWSSEDPGWIRAFNRVIANEEDGVPEIPRFNFGQKLVFWAMAFLVPVLFFSGLVIWEVYFSTATTIEQQRIALLVHSLAAIGSIMVWIGHVYAGLWISGSLRAIMQGWVTPGWAYRHHRKWFKRLVATGSRGPQPRR
jgi:formate dehydrogenase subunit gamma